MSVSVETETSVKTRKSFRLRAMLLLLAVAWFLAGIHYYLHVRVSPMQSFAAPDRMSSMPPLRAAPSAVVPQKTPVALRIRDAGDASPGVAIAASVGAQPVRLALSSDEIVSVGQLYELAIRMNPPRSVGRLSFIVSVDPHMLHLRRVRAADSSSVDAAGLISEDGHDTGRTMIDMDRSSAVSANGDDCLAVMQFEALASGSAGMVISDLEIIDAAGATIPYAASSLTAHAEVLSGPL